MITWRDIKNPPAGDPLPLPMPSRYVGATVAFGLLGLVGEMFTDKIPAVLAVGLLVGMGFQQAQAGKTPYSSAPSSSTGIKTTAQNSET